MAYRRRSTSRSRYNRSTGTRARPRASARRGRATSRRMSFAGRPQEIRLVVESVAASPISRGEALLAKMNPAPKRAKY